MTDSALPGAIELPDGCWIRGRGLRSPAPAGPVPGFGLYLGTRRLRRRHQMPWPHRWIDWPDFLLPRDSGHAIELIYTLHDHAQAGQRAEVACGGGVGRTGTVIACLAVLAGRSPAEAIIWTRSTYHHRAIETPWQRRWVTRFAAS